MLCFADHVCLPVYVSGSRSKQSRASVRRVSGFVNVTLEDDSPIPEPEDSGLDDADVVISTEDDQLKDVTELPQEKQQSGTSII